MPRILTQLDQGFHSHSAFNAHDLRCVAQSKHVQEAVERTLYLKANSWYLGASVSGKPLVFLPYLDGHGNYRKKCDDVAAVGYKGFEFNKASVAQAVGAN